jgi:hypothetical protein
MKIHKIPLDASDVFHIEYLQHVASEGASTHTHEQ